MTSRKCYVYVIGKETNPTGNTYVGVSYNPQNRFLEHSKSNEYFVGRAIRKHQLTYSENCRVIFEGSANDCFALEKELRPTRNIGWNVSEGGRILSEQRNEKISRCFKGRVPPWMHKVHEARKRNGTDPVGARNGRAKSWLLISPDGSRYDIRGELDKICEQLELTVTVLRGLRGTTVPEPNRHNSTYKRMTQQQKQFRENTTGWLLIDKGYLKSFS